MLKYGLFFILNCMTSFQVLSEDINGAAIMVPLRIHFVKAKEYTPLDTPEDISIEKTMQFVNEIWSQANIEFYIDKTIFHSAQNVGKFKRVVMNNKSTRKEKVSALRGVCPKPKSYGQGIDVCVVRKSFHPKHGGVAFRFSKLSPMVIWPLSSNNRDSQNPATLAHEIGHALSLSHSGIDDIYLMRGQGNNLRRVGKYNKIRLTDSEIAKARKLAKKIGD